MNSASVDAGSRSPGSTTTTAAEERDGEKAETDGAGEGADEKAETGGTGECVDEGESAGEGANDGAELATEIAASSRTGWQNSALGGHGGVLDDKVIFRKLGDPARERTTVELALREPDEV